MAGLLRNWGIFARNAVRSQCMVEKVVSVRLYSSQLTLTVRKKIEDRRQRAQEAGGKKRIDKQHEKVRETMVENGLDFNKYD